MQSLSPEIIEKKILENYIDYQYLFVEFQSKFLVGLYSRYQSVENGNLVLYFAKQTHQEILRQRDYDFNYNISYDKFWENHYKISPKQRSLNRIAGDTLLPKETARRKIFELTKQKVLNKKNRITGWLPSEKYKEIYNLVIIKEIDEVCKLISFICEKINLPVTREEVIKEMKEKFSFIWFHYLDTQLQYLKLWNKRFNDHELILIFLQIAYLFTSKAKEKNLSHKNIYDNPSLLKEFISASISATSIAEVTGIPRATCVRKLEILVNLNAISKDEISKRYYIVPSAVADDLISRKLTEDVVELFSNFFFVCLKSISLRT